MKKVWILGLCAWAALLSGERVASADLITGFDLVVGGNLNSQGGQIQGRTAVVGDIIGGGFPVFGTKLLPAADFSDIDSLVVGGGLKSNGITMQAGDARLGGTRGSAGVNLNGPGSQLFQNDVDALSRANDAVIQGHAASDYFAGLAANSTWTVSGSNITFLPTVGINGIAVFDIPASLLYGDQNANFGISLAGVPAGTSFVFNTIGSVTTTPLGNFGTGFTNSAVNQHILWNFADQTSQLNLSREWYGSVLLPNASMTTTSPINGTVFVGQNLTTSADIRIPGYSGAMPAAISTVPEPSSLVLFSLAGVAYGARRVARRRSNAQSV